MTDIPTSTPAWSDDSRPTSDIPGREDFSSAVAARINRCGTGSTVFGIVGPWGSGKTTLLRTIVQQLGSWNIVWFSPWSVADVGSITAEFVSALAEAFPQSQGLRTKLANYSRFGTPALKMIPVVGDAVASVTAEVLAEMTKRPAWHTEFAKLSAEIEAEGRRVLVIVDDVDRLDGEELRALLRVVRLLGRFTNVHYLLAYDQATIDRLLGSVSASGESSEFMEKIVQFPFEVPPAPLVVRRRWGRTIVDFVSPASETARSDQVEHREELVKLLAAGLETPRAAERLREQMFSLAELVANAEVDALDFTALTWLRIAHHPVWNDIRLHPDEYLSWREDDSDLTRESRKQRIESLVGRPGHAKPVWDAVKFLFDPMGIAGALAGRRWRIQGARYFDRYFQIGLADDDVSERKTENALRSLAAAKTDDPDIAELRSIILGQDEERGALALDVVGNLRRDSIRTSLAILQFVETIATELAATSGSNLVRVSATDRWLAKEIYLALLTRLAPSEELVARFGYQRLVSSAYVAKRNPGHDESVVKRLYAEMARAWVADVRGEQLLETLDREELLAMTSFLIWIEDAEDHRGFLADRVTDATALIDAAVQFVFFNEWVGAGIEYDVVFREQEFRFAIGKAFTPSLMAQVTRVADVPDYEVSDLPSRNLTEAQLRDFATRSVQELDFP